MIESTQGKNSPMGNVVELGAHIGDMAAIDTFASACGLPVEEVAEWVKNGTLPSIVFAGQRLVDVRRLRADLLTGKQDFVEGGYNHE